MLTPRHVVAVMDSYAVSGPGRQLIALANALPERGIQLSIIVFQRRRRPPAPFVSLVRESGLRHAVIDESGPTDLGVVAAVGAVLSAWQPDVVQTHGYRPTAIVAALRLKRPAWRWVGFFHGSTTENLKVRIYHQLDYLLLRRADRVVVVAESQRRLFRGLDLRLSVINNAVLPPERTAGPTGASGSSFAPDLPAPRLGVIGRLSPEKGVDVLLQSVALLRSAGVSLSVLVAGDGPERDALESMARALRIDHAVRFMGHVKDPWQLYPQLDVVVIPSRSEGMPNVLLEALAADRPVVATAVGAIPEMLSDPDAGTVVPPNDPEALANGIRLALSGGHVTAAHAARRCAADRFSLAARVAAHESLYDSLLGQ